jgi:transcriptional regulator with GAF, ATPase, and Fis domain
LLRLEVRHKTKGTSFYENDKSTVFLGRDRSMDVVLDDPLASRQHAVIIRRGTDVILQDIGGKNPVRVNGQEIVSRVLATGDSIEIGETAIIIRGMGAATDGPAVSPLPADVIVKGRVGLECTGDVGAWKDDPGDETVSAPVFAAQPPAGQPWLTSGLGDRHSHKKLRILRSFSDLIRHLADRQKLLDAALGTVFDNLEVRRGFIGFFTHGSRIEIVAERNQGDAAGGEGRSPSYSRSVVDRVRLEGVAILFSDAPEESEGSASMLDSKSAVKLNIKCAMCLPLFRSERVVGVLYMDNRERSESFTQEDLYFASVLSHLISLALEKEHLYEKIQEENIELRTILHHKNRFVGVSQAAKDVHRKIKKVAGFDTTVLITGESGTGKELVARAIHDRSPRRASPFVAVNCAAIPETLLESELFGYAPKSGISGSDPKGKPGKFEQAHGGTVFLDEIGDMSVSTQAKILRVLENKVVDRLGGMEGIRVDLRIVAATNRVLEKAVQDGSFREDLYYRLKVFKIDLPPLRCRREDILPLCQHFLSFHHPDSRGPLEISPRARELLLAYHWPGNIRELKNSIEEAVLLSNGRTIYPENLPVELRRDDVPQPFGTLEEVEAQHVGRVLQSVNWNKRRAAEILGINRSTLYEKIRAYAIERPREPANGDGEVSPLRLDAEDGDAPGRAAAKTSAGDGLEVQPAPSGF